MKRIFFSESEFVDNCSGFIEECEIELKLRHTSWFSFANAIPERFWLFAEKEILRWIIYVANWDCLAEEPFSNWVTSVL